MQQLGPEGARMWRLAGIFGALGMEMAIAVCVGTWAGEQADSFWNLRPWGSLIGFAMGLGAAVLGLLRAMQSAKAMLARKSD